VLDARRGEVYAAAFEGEAGARPAAWLPEGVYGAAELARRCPAPCRVVGEGVALCAQALRQALGARVALAPPPAGRARARCVGALGARRLARGEAGPAADLVPRYLRRAEAEVRRTGLRTEPGGPL
jgi:tRNA threonylcarbamoyladenosine biosynthesis protein TsaB